VRHVSVADVGHHAVVHDLPGRHIARRCHQHDEESRARRRQETNRPAEHLITICADAEEDQDECGDHRGVADDRAPVESDLVGERGADQQHHPEHRTRDEFVGEDDPFHANAP
jgi:hypothetical protein